MPRADASLVCNCVCAGVGLFRGMEREEGRLRGEALGGQRKQDADMSVDLRERGEMSQVTSDEHAAYRSVSRHVRATGRVPYGHALRRR